jgi:hypothetical protein
MLNLRMYSSALQSSQRRIGAGEAFGPVSTVASSSDETPGATNLANPKSSNLHAAVSRHENVSWLQIPMNDSFVMRRSLARPRFLHRIPLRA